MSIKLNKKTLLELQKATRDIYFGQKYANPIRYAYLNGGGDLFDSFSNQPDYKLNIGETQICQDHGESIALDMKDIEHLIIVGQGLAYLRKEHNFAKHLPNLKAITFIDVSQKFNAAAKKDVEAHRNEFQNPNLTVSTITGSYQEIPDKTIDKWKKQYGRTGVVSLGSLVTNIEEITTDSFPESELQKDLRKIFRLACNDGYVTLGYSAQDSQSDLQKSYAHPLLEKFWLNDIHQMNMLSPGLRLEDMDGNVLDKDDPEVIRELFSYEMANAKYDSKTRNYPHIMIAKKPFKAFYKLDDDSDGHQEECREIEPDNYASRMGNSYQLTPNLVNKNVRSVGQTATNYDTDEGLARSKGGAVVHTFKVTPQTSDENDGKPKAAAKTPQP